MQLAEGLLRHLAGDRFEVQSAVTEPKDIAQQTIEVMSKIGIDVSRLWSKPVEEFAGQQFGYVITVRDTAHESCPMFPGPAKQLHWSVEDPAGAEARGLPMLDASEQRGMTCTSASRNSCKEEVGQGA